MLFGRTQVNRSTKARARARHTGHNERARPTANVSKCRNKAYHKLINRYNKSFILFHSRLSLILISMLILQLGCCRCRCYCCCCRRGRRFCWCCCCWCGLLFLCKLVTSHVVVIKNLLHLFLYRWVVLSVYLLTVKYHLVVEKSTHWVGNTVVSVTTE